MSDDTPEPAAPAEGQGLVTAAAAGTGAVVAAGLAGAIAPDSLAGVTVAISVALFAVGVVGILYGYAVGVVRSREDAVTLAGLFWLAGTAPAIVRFRLRLAFAIQVVVAVAVASIRPYTAVAFISLTPMFGLGMLAAWGARHGTFFPKDG